MSQENVEIVRRCYGFWAERDFSQLTEIFDPDVVIDLSRNVFNPDIYRGYDGFRRAVEVIDEVWEGLRIDPEEYVDAGKRVVAKIRISGAGRGSGVETEMKLFNVWTLRDGKVVQLTGGYRDRDEALEAAGLRE